MLAVIETHPIQYHAPVYRALQTHYGIPVVALYGADFSLAGYADREFGATFAWDTDLLSGYAQIFLSRVAEGGARSAEQVSTRGLRAALAAVGPAAVLLVGYSPRFHQLAFLEAWRQGYPLLMRGETTDHARSRSAVKTQLRDRALQVLYGRCQRLLYVGQRSRQHFARLGCAPEKLVFSPYCIDPAPFEVDDAARKRLRPLTRQALGIGDDQLVVLFSGKLSRRKGPDLLVQAVRGLPAAYRERIVVAFVGSGELQPDLETEARVDPAVSVRFVGFQNQTRLSAYYHAADMLALPSRHSETWGLVVNEALQHGLPCVVSEGVGCAPDLVEPGSTGEIVAVDSADDLARGLERGLRLAGRHETREACRRKVLNYSVGRAADGLAEAYEAVTWPRR